MIYVTDTHSLMWFIEGNNQLSPLAKEIFEEAEKGNRIIIVPTIVLAELLHFTEHKHTEDHFSLVVEKLREGANYLPHNLDIPTMVGCKGLIKINEIHDKIITATARMTKRPLITRDKEITESGYVKTIW